MEGGNQYHNSKYFTLPIKMYNLLGFVVILLCRFITQPEDGNYRIY